MTPRGIEPRLQDRKSCVLTVRRWGLYLACWRGRAVSLSTPSHVAGVAIVRRCFGKKRRRRTAQMRKVSYYIVRQIAGQEARRGKIAKFCRELPERSRRARRMRHNRRRKQSRQRTDSLNWNRLLRIDHPQRGGSIDLSGRSYSLALSVASGLVSIADSDDSLSARRIASKTSRR